MFILYFQVDLRWILFVIPLPLSQGVLLTLLWQLACDINNNLLQKLAWMTVVANAMIPTNPGLQRMGSPSYFKSMLYSTINVPCLQLKVMSSQVSVFLMNIINSMLMASD
jgi:enhancer of mRNA-decapping protein 4